MPLSPAYIDRIAAVTVDRRDESHLEREQRLESKRLTLSRQLERERDAEAVATYTSGEWTALERRLRVLHLQDRDFLPWLKAQRWLLEAHEDLRRVALRKIGRRIDKLKSAAGLPTLDDPLPPASSVYLEVRKALAVR